MNSKALFAKAKSLYAQADERLWELGALAYAASLDDGITERWDIVISRATRRAPSTVRGWKLGWETYLVLDRSSPGRLLDIRQKLSFSFFVAAAGSADKLPADDLIDLLRAYADDDGASVESFRAALDDIAEDPDAAKWPRLLERAAELLARVADDPQTPTLVRLTVKKFLSTALKEKA